MIKMYGFEGKGR